MRKTGRFLVLISAKRDGVCAESGQEIKKGEKCLYFPRDKKVYALTSQTGKAYFDCLEDEDLGGVRY